MALALDAAREAAEQGEVPVGAVVVQGDDVLAVERNRMRALRDATAHAELAALRAAMQRLGAARLDGCALYVTLEPCPMCAGALVLSRLSELVFGAFDAKSGGAITHFGIANSPVLNHRVEVIGGVMAGESLDLLQTFFRARRGAAEDASSINPFEL